MKRATAQRLAKYTLRELRGPYSQVECAKSIDIAPTTLQAWDDGKAQPNPESLRKLLDHYIRWKKQYNQDPQPTVNEVLSMIFPQVLADEDQKGE